MALYYIIISTKLLRMENFCFESGFNEVPVSLNAALALSSCSSASYENLEIWKTTGQADDLEEVDFHQTEKGDLNLR